MGLFGSKVTKEEKSEKLLNEGIAYYNTKNFIKAWISFESAARLGNLEALYRQADLSQKGLTGKKDAAFAKRLYEEAAEKGLARAQSELALMYYNGKEIKQDYTKALYWFQKAAGQGNDMAQYGLALMYQNGEGVVKDPDKAAEWAEKAAAQGTDEFKKDAEELLAEIRKAQGGMVTKTETPPAKATIPVNEAPKPADNTVSVMPEATAGVGLLSVKKGRELYNAGMEHYRAGRLAQAMSCFNEAAGYSNAEAIGIMQGNPVVETASTDVNIDEAVADTANTEANADMVQEAAEPLRNLKPESSYAEKVTEIAEVMETGAEDTKTAEVTDNAGEVSAEDNFESGANADETGVISANTSVVTDTKELKDNKSAETCENGERYEGEIKDGKRNGYGICTYAGGDKYEGQWADGEKSGEGTIAYANGASYTGQWKYGKRHGHGTYTYKDGNIYMGEWENGKKNGKGTMRSPKGAVYDGEWVNDNMYGAGKMLYNDGAVYEGQWVDDKRHGKGTNTYANGSSYTGHWADDKRHGQGTYIYTNGNVYTGEWVGGDRNGEGSMRYSDGAVYNGQWKDNKRHGIGAIEYKNKTVYTGEWENDKRIGLGVINYISGTQYIGEWADDEYSGIGIYLWTDGDKYAGEWKNGVQNGQGAFLFVSGNEYVGEFKDGEKNGKGIFRWPDGDIQIGRWSGDHRNGVYVLIKTNGSLYSQKFDNDEFIGETLIRTETKKNPVDIAGLVIGDETFIGQFKDRKLNGYGLHNQVLRESPWFYMGEWQNGTLSGLGTMMDEFVNSYIGEWVEGDYNGFGKFEQIEGTLIGRFKEKEMNGKGVRINNLNHYIYVGEHTWSKMDGRGLMVLKSGKKYICNYRLNELINIESGELPYGVSTIYTTKE